MEQMDWRNENWQVPNLSEPHHPPLQRQNSNQSYIKNDQGLIHKSLNPQAVGI